VKKIELVDDLTGVRAIAELHESAAPGLSAAMWDALETPIRSMSLHAMMSGREIMLEVPQENQRFDPTRLPPENLTITPLPGEIGFAYFPASTLIDMMRPGQESDDGAVEDRAEAFWDITIFYGRDTRLLTVHGWVPASVWATIVEGLAGFANCCKLVRTSGRRPMTMRRLDG
jgi:hypothetical protein